MKPGFLHIALLLLSLMFFLPAGVEAQTDGGEGTDAAAPVDGIRTEDGLQISGGDGFTLPPEGSTVDADLGLTPTVAAPSPFIRDLRRFEIISLGTLPFTLFFSNIGYSVGRYVKYGVDYGFNSDITAQYQPLLFGDRGFTNTERSWILLSALGTSFILATIDLSIEHHKKSPGGDGGSAGR